MDGKDIPTEIELQRIYDLSKIESEMYVMKLQGSKYQEIADYHNVSLQSVKQTIYNATKKIKGRDSMSIIVSMDSRDSLTRRATAEMVLRVVNMDVDGSDFRVGTHTMLLTNIPNEIGSLEFIDREVIPYCDILANSSAEARTKAERFYRIYCDKGGEKGKIGVGIVNRVFTQFMVRHDIY